MYRDDQGSLLRVDFYLDGRIASRPWGGGHFHVIPNTDDDALSNLAALCQVMERRYRAKPPEHLYAFRRNPHAYVDVRTGELHLGGSLGASCASFVLIVLSSAGIELVESGEGWPYREGPDSARHEELIEILRQQNFSESYIERICTELPCPRVAPEEVAGAAMYPDLRAKPAPQSFAEDAAKWIVDLWALNAKHRV